MSYVRCCKRCLYHLDGSLELPRPVDEVRVKIDAHIDHSSSFHGGDFISIALWKIKLQALVDQLASIKADQNNKCQQH